jgi:hypothetical protein
LGHQAIAARFGLSAVPWERRKNRLALKSGDPFAFAGITPLSHRRSLIWIKGRNPFEGFLEVTGTFLVLSGSEDEGAA